MRWRALSFPAVMPLMGISFTNLAGGMLFGAIGFVALYHGRRVHRWRAIISGIALMAFPYFITDTLALYAFGLVGTAALFFPR